MKILSSVNFGNRKRDKRKMPRFLEKIQSIMKLFTNCFTGQCFLVSVLLTKMNQLKERKMMILNNCLKKRHLSLYNLTCQCFHIYSTKIWYRINRNSD